MRSESQVRLVVFVLDQSFGTLRRTDEPEGGIVGIDTVPGVLEIIAGLKRRRLRVQLSVAERCSPEERALLKRVLPGVNSVVVGPPEACAGVAALVVSADRVVRGRAAVAGQMAVPHPLFVPLVAGGGRPRFLVFDGARATIERLPDLIPYHTARHSGERLRLYAAGTDRSVVEAARRGIEVRAVPFDFATQDPILVHLDERSEAAIEALGEVTVLESDGNEALVALDATQTNNGIGLHGAHGHALALAPSPELLAPAPGAKYEERLALLEMVRWPWGKLKATRVSLFPDLAQLLPPPCPATAASFQADVDRFSGVAALDATGPIASRHIEHPDNPRVVDALLAELRAIGYCAYTHAFSHGGRTLHNVIADLPGIGNWLILPHFPHLIREIILKLPWPDPPDPWVKRLTAVGGAGWAKALNLAFESPFLARHQLEVIARLKPWYPWWRQLCLLPGPGAELVLVGCHLDSTAASTPGYQPTTDPSPGADDDASGIAATLALARQLRNAPSRLRHTVRFCFFNAEEQGLIGSKAYAQHMKAASAPIRAVICMDMIGYNSDANRIFEIHAGYTDAAVRDASLPIADAIAAWAACLSVLPPAQVYRGTSQTAGAPDRTLYDGAINRSDHAAFHQQGYPAVVVSEDFFANLSAEPGADPNPDYHRSGDLVIDAAYAADITCAIAMAVRELAGV